MSARKVKCPVIFDSSFPDTLWRCNSPVIPRRSLQVLERETDTLAEVSLNSQPNALPPLETVAACVGRPEELRLSLTLSAALLAVDSTLLRARKLSTYSVWITFSSDGMAGTGFQSQK